MKGQISRDSFRPRQRYSGVFQIQGAMVTDADLGEKCRIGKRQIDELGQDTVNDGVPETGGAVQIGAGDVPSLEQGVIYADGVRGALTAANPGDLDGPLDIFTNQTDLPVGPDLPAGHQVIYADIWERPVFALEDGYLADAGLHGAETAFRTRTMTQLKAIETGIAEAEHGDPMTADEVEAVIASLPGIGSGQLAVATPDAEAQIDECDPCAEVVTAEQSIANALWRLEVIAVDGPPTSPTSLTLAWSIENGSALARAAAVTVAGTEREAFERSGKVYEFFSVTTESHRGVFDNPADACRPTFVDDLSTTPTPATDHDGSDWPFVRRWDGCAEIDLGTGDFETQGAGFDFDVDGDLIELTVDAFTATLDLAGAAVVAGDYWLVELRSFAAEPDRVQLVQAGPIGVVHHYCSLFAVHDGAAVALTDSQARKLSFPTLADLPATHVGFDNNCPKLYNDAENVQEALDELCSISAQDIAFDPATCPELYDGADNVHDALANLCKVDFSTERLLRLLHDWGVLCGIVPSLPKAGAGVVTITGGSFLDRAGRIGSFEGGELDLNQLPREQIHFVSDVALRDAFAKGEVCLALALGEGGKITVHLVSEQVAFGPADPTYQQRVTTCIEGKKPIAIDDRFKILDEGDRAVAEKMFLVVNKRDTFGGAAKLTAEEAGRAESFNQLMLEEYKASASEQEFELLQNDWRVIAEEIEIGSAIGATREVRFMQLHSRQMAALLERDQDRALRCVCDLLFPTCPPDLGEPPFFVPIACLTGSFDAQILINELCPYCCRKQAMTWRAVQYFFGDWRDTVAETLAESCCHPDKKDEPTKPGARPGFVYQPDLYKNLDLTRFSERFELRDSLIGVQPTTPSDYKARVPIGDLSPDEAKRALAGNGVEIVEEIDLDDSRAFELIQEKSLRVGATDRLTDDGKIRPGDKVALLVQDGVARDYVLLERGTGKYLFETAPIAATPGLEIGKPSITLEETERFEGLVAAAESARGSFNELDSRRVSIATDVTALQGELDSVAAEHKQTVDAVATARVELDQLTIAQAGVKTELETTKAELEETRAAIEAVKTELETTRLSLDSAKTEIESAEGQREEIIGSLRKNQPVASVATDRALAAALAEEGVLFVGDVVEMSDAKLDDMVRRRVLTKTQATQLKTQAETFVKTRL